MKYEYKSAKGTVEFDEKWIKKLKNPDLLEHNSQQTETKCQCLLDQMNYEEDIFATENCEMETFITGETDEERLHNAINQLNPVQKVIIIAKRATKNANSSEVVLGKFNQDNISYIEVAQKRNATYFQLDDWNNVVNTIGENNIWKVNEQFIHEQLIQNKNFILSHNPFSATGYYKKEIEYLTKQGYQFAQNGDIWKALK